AVGDGDGLGMVGQGDVAVAKVAGGGAHFLDGVFAVGGVGMHLEVATNVGEGEELGEMAGFGGFDLAGILAQLGLDIGKLELGVNVLFGFGGDDAVSLEGGEGVLVESVAHGVGAAAEADVVLF